MESRLTKGIQLISSHIIFISLIVIFIFKSLGYLGVVNPYDALFSYIVISYLVILSVKTIFILKNENNVLLKTVFPLFDLGIILYLVVISSPLTWSYFLLSILIVHMTLLYGRKHGLIILLIGSLVIPADLLINKFFAESRILELCTIYAIQIFIWYLVSLLEEQKAYKQKELSKQEQDLKKQISQNKELEEKYLNMEQHNENLEKANKKLENTNQKLNKSAAEYYTLQQISQAIANILDIEELLQFVNDVMIGVLGVNYSTIAILDKSKNQMNVKVTNISYEEALQALNFNIDCEVLNDVAKNLKPVIDNNVNKNSYPFVKGRNVHSILCVPLASKNENYGLVMVEQERQDAFEDEHLKFLSAIGNQVSVALENVGLYEKMQRMATIDELTKIYNRLYFNEMLSKEMANADQHEYPMCVAIFDIDHFKKFNDTYGHLFGDLVLKTIARLAQDNIREEDLVARFGGEEFVIIMPNITTYDAFQVVENLRQIISDYKVKEGTVSASVTASFGIGCYPKHGTNEAEVVSAADNALYAAKTEGRNCTRIFREDNEKANA